MKKCTSQKSVQETIKSPNIYEKKNINNKNILRNKSTITYFQSHVSYLSKVCPPIFGFLPIYASEFLEYQIFIFYRLDRIEDLADIKDEESEQFDKHMEEINGKKTLLQNEISRLNTGTGYLFYSFIVRKKIGRNSNIKLTSS